MLKRTAVKSSRQVHQQIQAKKQEKLAETIIKNCGLAGKIDRRAYKKLSSKEKLQYVCDMADKVMEYNRFWSQGDTYFAGDWLNDERKFKSSVRMLELEMEVNKGQIDLIKLSNENRREEMMVIQEILGAEPTGEIDPVTIECYISRIPSDKGPNYKLTTGD